MTRLFSVLSPVLAPGLLAGIWLTGILLAGTWLATSPAMAEDVQLGDLTLSNPWTRAMPRGASAGGGFLTITNHGTQDDRLIAASSPLTARVELHEMAVIDNIMKMREMTDGIVLPAGETVMLKPGGLHVMFMNLEAPFSEGEMVAVTLTFEKSGSIDVSMPVQKMGTPAMMPGMAHDQMPSGQMQHGQMQHGQPAQ